MLHLTSFTEDAGAQLAGWGGSPLPFFENRKKVPWSCKKVPYFGKMCPVCVHAWVKILIQNVILRASWRKKTKFFPCGAFILCVTHETFIEVPSIQETSPAPKNSWLRAWDVSLSQNIPRFSYANSFSMKFRRMYYPSIWIINMHYILYFMYELWNNTQIIDLLK